MWFKEILIVQLIVLQNTVSSQPLIEKEKNRVLRQAKYEECCPCPSVSDGVSFRDQDLTPSQKSSFLRMPLDECPCRSGFDNEGSPSIFYPSFLRGAHPVDRTREIKQDPKPLLRPEVGLASSVLETLKEATEEEYKDALMRDASRTALKAAEPDLLDTEAGTTKHSVTIVVKPRDLDNGNDPISEASHTHETRCIHKPLRNSNFENSRRIALPLLSKEYLLLPKRKLSEPLHKSLFDMDNSPSNIQENFDDLNRNDHRNKLRINPSLLSGLADRIDELRNSGGNPGAKLQMTSEQCDDLNKRTTLKSSPMFTLAAFKNKLRDINEKRNAKRLNNNLQAGLIQHQFNVMDTKSDDETKKMSLLRLAHFNKGIDGQSPLVKNILKLRDVELLPPRKTNTEDIFKTIHKQSDLKAAGTESKADIVISPKIPTEKFSKECDIINSSVSDEIFLEEPEETKPKSIKSYVSTSPVLMEGNQENRDGVLINKPSSSLIKSMCDETDILDSPAERDLNYNIKTDFQNEFFNFDDQHSNVAEENIDSEPESTNILEQINEEDENIQNNNFSEEANDSDEDDCSGERFSTVSPINLPSDMDEKGTLQSLSVVRKSSQPSSLKDDILRKLENLRNTVNTKFADSEFDRIRNTQLTPTMSAGVNTLKENPVETNDLQKLSDSLLKQDMLSRSNSAIKKTECVINDISSDNTLTNNESYETSYLKVNNNESFSLELYETNGQLHASRIPSKNIMKSNLTERVNTSLNPSIQNLNQIQDNTCTVSNETYEVADEDISKRNEMFSQPSNFNFRALRPQFSDNHLRSSLPQDIADEKIILKKKDSKNNFQVPSLEEIKQSITNIIEAGQREEEDLRLIDSDPLKESSNINLVRLADTNSKLKVPKYDHSPFSSLQSNSLFERLNLNSHKNRGNVKDVVSLKPLKLPTVQNNRAGIFGDHLSSGKDKIKSLPMSKSALNTIGSPFKETLTLNKIRDSMNTNSKSLFREVPFRLQQPHLQLPIRNTGSHSLNSLKNGLQSYADNSVQRAKSDINELRKINQGTLSKSKIDSNNIFETITRRREDMKEKLQALHIDFNDRLATIHDRLRDQTNLQSIDVPVYTENNVKNLPVNDCKQEEPKQFLKSKFSSKQDHKFNALKDFKNVYTSRDNDDQELITKQKEELSNKPFLNVKKLSNPNKIKTIEAQRNYIGNQRGVKPPYNGHFKISFSSSTAMPVTKQKTTQPNYAKKGPIGVLRQNNKYEKKNAVDSKLKEISNAYRMKINNYEDSKHSPSELLPLRIESTNENKPMKNLSTAPEGNFPLLRTAIPDNPPKMGTMNTIPKSMLDAKNAHLVKSVAPLPKENPLVTNIREALKSRFANIKPTTSTSSKDNQHLVPFLDTVTSPSESSKTVEVLHNPLTENTSYKCTMMCVRE